MPLYGYTLLATGALMLVAAVSWLLLRLYQAMGFYVPAGRLGRLMPRLLLLAVMLGVVATAAAIVVEEEPAAEEGQIIEWLGGPPG